MDNFLQQLINGLTLELMHMQSVFMDFFESLILGADG
jgi:hypothetical protein